MSSQSELEHLITEERNPRTMDLDCLETNELVRRIQAEDFQVADSVREAIPQISNAVDLIVERLRKGGRLIYFGAGTSGRLGILDASECPPTYGVALGLVTGYIAGGPEAIMKTIEGAEDYPEFGEQDALAANVGAKDIVCGITASGRTPYVIGALRKAKELGAAVIGVTSNETGLSGLCDVTIVVVTGPEAIAGSTRMKSGTAQKMVLNLLTTCTMVRLGKVYENLMVDVTPTNHKLRERSISMIKLICAVPRHIAEGALVASGNNVKTAILMIAKKIGHAQAEQLLAKCHGSLRKALQV